MKEKWIGPTHTRKLLQNIKQTLKLLDLNNVRCRASKSQQKCRPAKSRQIKSILHIVRGPGGAPRDQKPPNQKHFTHSKGTRGSPERPKATKSKAFYI